MASILSVLDGGGEPPSPNPTLLRFFDEYNGENLASLPILHSHNDKSLIEIYYVGKQTLKINYDGGEIFEV